MLEQTLEMYQPLQTQRTEAREPTAYVVSDLESLSAVALYYGKGNPIMPGEMTIRPLGPNVQLHIKEGAGGTAHLKTRDGQYQSLGSYEAAMLDLLMDEYEVKKIRTEDKSERKGRT